MIVDAYKNDTKLQEIVQLVSIGEKTDYPIDESGGLLYKSRLCVRQSWTSIRLLVLI